MPASIISGCFGLAVSNASKSEAQPRESGKAAFTKGRQAVYICDRHPVMSSHHTVAVLIFMYLKRNKILLGGFSGTQQTVRGGMAGKRSSGSGDYRRVRRFSAGSRSGIRFQCGSCPACGAGAAHARPRCGFRPCSGSPKPCAADARGLRADRDFPSG